MSVTAGQVKSGMLWIAGISLLRDGLQFGVMLVLMRLLDASVYGEYSLVSSILGLLTVFSFHSFLEHSLQVRPGEIVDYQAHFTFGAFTQVLAVLVLNVTALALRGFPAYAPIAPVLSVMSISFVLDWGAELRVKMLERELNWTRLRTLEAIGIAGSAVAAIALAWWGAGVYALLLPALVALLPFAFDLFVVTGWRPSWQFDWSAFQPTWRYGMTRLASGLVARGQQVLESGVLAAVIGLASLGIYGRAVGLATFACLKLTAVMTVTLFPMVTRFVPSSHEFRRASGLVLRAVAWTSIPAAALLAVTARPLVQSLYGAKWLQTVPLLPWALALAAMTALMEAAAFLLLANLEPRKTLIIDALNLLGTALALWWLLPFGLNVYLAGLVAVQVFLFAIALVWLVQSGAAEIKAIRQALVSPLVAAGCVAYGAKLFPVDSLIAAAVFGLIFGAIYVPGLRFFSKDAFLELLRFIPGQKRIAPAG